MIEIEITPEERAKYLALLEESHRWTEQMRRMAGE